MSIKMMVPAGHATQVLMHSTKELRSYKAELANMLDALELLNDIQGRMGAWVSGEYLLREYKEVCKVDATALETILMRCADMEVRTALRLVHGTLIVLETVRTKAMAHSLVEGSTRYFDSARCLARLLRTASYHNVKSGRRANKLLSRCRTPAVKLSKKEKLAIVCKHNPDLGTWVREWAADGHKFSYGSILDTAVYSRDYNRPKGETIARRLSASVRCELAGKAFYASANTAYNRLNCWLEILRYGESLMAMRQRKNQTQLFAERLPDVTVKVWE